MDPNFVPLLSDRPLRRRREKAGSRNTRRSHTSGKQVAKDYARLAAIVESCGEPIITKDLNGIIQTWNKGAEKLFGYRAEEIIGRSVSVLFPPDRLGEEDHILELLRRGKELERLETIRVTKEGRHIPVLVSVSPIKDEQGRVIGASKIVREITEITARARAQQEQEHLYRLVQAVNQARALPEIYAAALEAIVACCNADRASILFLDSGGTMRFKAWRKLSEQYRQAVEGHSPWSADEPDPRPVCIEHAEQIPQNLRDTVQREGIEALAFIPITYESRLMGKFMTYYHQPHRFTEDELRVAQTIASQVAFAVQRHETRQELEKQVRERTAKLQEMVTELQQVSYAITHDMRAPLRAMSTFATLMLEELASARPAPEHLQSCCRRIINSAGRLDRLILDSLNYTKLVLDSPALHPVDLALLLPSLIESYPNLHAGEVTIRVQDPLPVVLGEESMLTQCFSNLLGNAIKFVAPGVRPEVRIRVQQAGSTAKIIVEDNGIGIPAYAQLRLFGMFQRLTVGYDGTGVGLAIVRKVVERMGGKVGVESEPSKGSRFWVELQRVEAAQAAVPNRAKPHAN